jgi:hypothetical protein
VKIKLGMKFFENWMNVWLKTVSSKRTYHLFVAPSAAMLKWTNFTSLNPSDLGD